MKHDFHNPVIYECLLSTIHGVLISKQVPGSSQYIARAVEARLGNLPEFKGSTSQVRAQVTFKSQAKFESRSNFYISRFFLIFMSSGCCSHFYNDVLVVNGK